MITVALAKGALLKELVARFAAAGLDFSAVLDKDNRQLMLPTLWSCPGLLVRNGDVPTYVAMGRPNWVWWVSTFSRSTSSPWPSWLISALAAVAWRLL